MLGFSRFTSFLSGPVQGGLRVLVLAMPLLSLAGCAGLGGVQQTPEARVAERAQARWDAHIAGHWESAYHFATPAYRAVVDLDGYRARHGGQAAWLGARVPEVRCETDVCEATVRLKFRSLLPPRVAELETDYVERWIFESGDWWVFLRP